MRIGKAVAWALLVGLLPACTAAGIVDSGTADESNAFAVGRGAAVVLMSPPDYIENNDENCASAWPTIQRKTGLADAERPDFILGCLAGPRDGATSPRPLAEPSQLTVPDACRQLVPILRSLGGLLARAATDTSAYDDIAESAAEVQTLVAEQGGGDAARHRLGLLHEPATALGDAARLQEPPAVAAAAGRLAVASNDAAGVCGGDGALLVPTGGWSEVTPEPGLVDEVDFDPSSRRCTGSPRYLVSGNSAEIVASSGDRPGVVSFSIRPADFAARDRVTLTLKAGNGSVYAVTREDLTEATLQFYFPEDVPSAPAELPAGPLVLLAQFEASSGGVEGACGGL